MKILGPWFAGLVALVGCVDTSAMPATTEPATQNAAASPATAAAERAAKPPSLRAEDIPLRLHVNEDNANPMKATKLRLLVVADTVDDATLRQAMLDYYGLMRAELVGARQRTRHVYLYVFPTEKRAYTDRAGWRAMLSSRAFDGRPLPAEPEGGITIRPQPTGDAVPTALEDQIYDEVHEALQAVDSAGDYQDKVMSTRGELSMADIKKMGRLGEQDEDNVKRRTAKKYKMTVAALDNLMVKVMAARM